MSAADSTAQLQVLLDALNAGHATARDRLLQASLERCRLLARRMFNRHRDLRGLDQTDDVLQLAMLRLHRALADVRPATVRDFFGLAARQIRWVLADLARKYSSSRLIVYHGDDLPTDDTPRDLAGEPADLLEWGELHQRIEALPPHERELFDLLFYQGLPQADAATLLGISLRSVKRGWQRARLLLREALRGEWPAL